MATFYGYVLKKKKKADFEVLSKVRTDVHGHSTYVLIGEYRDDDGQVWKCSSLVNKDQWDRYDVPVTERKPNQAKRGDYRAKKKRVLAKMAPTRRNKVYDQEIEKWLLEHSDMDFGSLGGNRITADE